MNEISQSKVNILKENHECSESELKLSVWIKIQSEDERHFFFWLFDLKKDATYDELNEEQKSNFDNLLKNCE
jgi:hypothetical protein